MSLPQLTVLKEIIIKIDNQAVFLNPKLAIPIRQTDIPAEHMTFRSREEIFWKVELLEYNAENKCWKVRITDYCIKDTQNFSRQQSTREVLRLSFESFDWQQLEPLLSSYHKIKLLDVLQNHETERLLKEETTGVRTLALTKSPKLPDIDKSLFTAEDIFNTGESDDVEGNVFRQDEKDILQFLISHHNTRNKKQLEYLSGHKQSANFRIRFTLHPNFGFLFLIEGMENNHNEKLI